MKKYIYIILIFTSINSFGQVVIPNDEANIDVSAELKIYSTDKGVLIPRLGALDLLSMNNPATGLWVYNTSNQEFYKFSGTEWESMTRIQSLPAQPAIKYIGEMFYNTSDNKLHYWNGSTWVIIGTL